MLGNLYEPDLLRSSQIRDLKSKIINNLSVRICYSLILAFHSVRDGRTNKRMVSFDHEL